MQQFSFTPFPELVTDRLILRNLEIGDDQDIAMLRSNEGVNQYIDRPKEITIEEARLFIYKIQNGISKNEWIYWVITLKNTNKLIGTICYWNFSKENTVTDLGYELLPGFQGKGIMQEALSRIIEFGFESMKLSAIEAYTNAKNTASVKLLEKRHFRKVENTGKEKDNGEIFYRLYNPTAERNEFTIGEATNRL